MSVIKSGDDAGVRHDVSICRTVLDLLHNQAVLSSACACFRVAHKHMLLSMSFLLSHNTRTERDVEDHV